MRIYLPVTIRMLAEADRAGAFAPAPLLAYAVTPALREWYASGDAEELEFAAMTDAARECLRLLAGELDADADAEPTPPRRVVVAADVADAAITLAPDLHPAAVMLAADVALADVAAVHVDDPAAAPDIAAAAALVRAADGGDPDAAFTVDGVEDHQLQWYATQEIGHLLGS